MLYNLSFPLHCRDAKLLKTLSATWVGSSNSSLVHARECKYIAEGLSSKVIVSHPHGDQVIINLLCTSSPHPFDKSWVIEDENILNIYSLWRYKGRR
ncbi:unnamed protein product [Cylicocyclus nassatus]|uniref:Uncharacterized protein n=1 Tax=Cylicocyclus nassatus TaxID=53992 RepID=A0AA36MDP7_CYLNA|nr:unnamed protein product [Cylicocyclus nassatus]